MKKNMKQVSKARTYWWISFAAMAAIFGLLLSDSRYSVIAMLELEFAPTQETFFATISENGYTKAFLEKCIYIYYAFIVSFTSLFYFSIIIVARQYGEKVFFYQRALMFLPGMLDVIEDTIMLYMIRHAAVSNMTYSLQMVMVYSKWVLVIPCSVLAVMALFKIVRNR